MSKQNQTHFDSKLYINEDVANCSSELYIDEENDNEVENYNSGKELTILISSDYNNNDTVNRKISKHREENLSDLDDIKYLDDYESDDNDNDLDREDTTSFPFPIPNNLSPLKRTSLTNQGGTKQLNDNWLKLKLKMETLKKDQSTARSAASSSTTARAWSSVLRMLKTAPTSTKLFLGIDSSQNVPMSLGSSGIVRAAGASKQGLSAVDSSRAGEATTTTGRSLNTTANSVSPIPIYKTLNNWNERTLRVLNSNNLFGGKLKEKALDNYLENLNEDFVDFTDPFMHYKMTGSHIDASKKIGVVNMAVSGVKNILKVKKVK